MPYVYTRNANGEWITIQVYDSKRYQKGRSDILFPSDYVVVDLETTGLSPACDKIIEFAGIRVRDSVITDTFASLINPECEIDDFITQLTGITNEMVSNSPTIEEVLPSIVDFIGDDIIIGHNIGFDINFLYDARMTAFELPISNNYVDTMRISRRLYPDLPHHRLQDIIKFLQIPSGTYHRALNDCEMTLKCFEVMREEVNNKYSSITKFSMAPCKRISPRADARTLSTDKTEFDTSHPLFGKLCVFTGTLEKMHRSDAMQIVLDFGGKCGNGVTQNTNYLILGNNDYCPLIKGGKSSKHKKAEELRIKGYDIEIIPENVFYDMIEG